MPYTIVLTLKSGEVTSSVQIFNVPMPKAGDTIELEYQGRMFTARVTAIGKTPGRAPDSQAEDSVAVQEM
jgi:ribosomal 50S subunit-recycling heat shock protein